VFYPGTTVPSTASTVTLAVGDERAGIDFQLQLVATARVEGTVQSADGALPQGTQITLVPTDQAGGPGVPGFGTSSRQPDRSLCPTVVPVNADRRARRFSRRSNPTANPAAGAEGLTGGFAQVAGGRGGGRGRSSSAASVDVAVSGQNINDCGLALQPGMTVSGRVSFEG
jgi:hypothetical protein